MFGTIITLAGISTVLFGMAFVFSACAASTWRARAEKAEAGLEAALIGERENRTMRDTARQWAADAEGRLDQISKFADWRSP